MEPAASFDDAETGVNISVDVNANQHTRCVAKKLVQTNIGRTKEKTCARGDEHQCKYVMRAYFEN